ncbi:MAG: hypothetical protein KME18_09455 [Phormidium tanganyikae FI6-MK23]|nr:hypothetical protein [Phormidium tanganyikae FI6-MK23]
MQLWKEYGLPNGGRKNARSCRIDLHLTYDVAQTFGLIHAFCISAHHLSD